MEEWDFKLTPHQQGLLFRFPKVLSEALIAKGYLRVKVRITSEGILLVPHKGPAVIRSEPPIELPDWEV